MAYLTDEERKEQAIRVTGVAGETLKEHINLHLPKGKAKELALLRLEQCLDWCRRGANEYVEEIGVGDGDNA